MLEAVKELSFFSSWGGGLVEMGGNVYTKYRLSKNKLTKKGDQGKNNVIEGG